MNTIAIVSDHYCAFECDYHPYFCTHWARSGYKCLLYFGNIHEPSPDINQNWPVPGNLEVGDLGYAFSTLVYDISDVSCL